MCLALSHAPLPQMTECMFKLSKLFCSLKVIAVKLINFVELISTWSEYMEENQLKRK